MKRREIIFFAQTLENSRVLIYLVFNEIQTSFCPCLSIVHCPALVYIALRNYCTLPAVQNPYTWAAYYKIEPFIS